MILSSLYLITLNVLTNLHDFFGFLCFRESLSLVDQMVEVLNQFFVFMKCSLVNPIHMPI